MNNVNAINKELSSARINLDQIYLDPNNPRFISMDWKEIQESNIDEHVIQRMTQERLEESFSIDKLVMNIETNGFLSIDRVIIKQFKEDKYVVLEGNRRICAAKIIKNKYQQNSDSVALEVYESLVEIDCLIYTGSEQQPSWIFQGLRHIMGIQDWSSFNKAKLLVKLMEEESLSLTDVGKKFGLTAYGAGQWVRGYYAFMRASEESDYSREVDEKAYPYLQELFSRSNAPLREWLNWNEAEYKFEDNLHFNEFLSWLYPRDEEEHEGGVDIKGDWTKRKIARSNDTRMISYLIRESPTDFEAFRADGELEKANNMANTKKYIRESDPSKEVFSDINSCIKAIENMPFKLIKNEREKLLDLFDRLEKAIAEIKESCDG